MITLTVKINYPDLTSDDEYELGDLLRTAIRQEIPRAAARKYLDEKRGYVNSLKIDVDVELDWKD